MPEPTTRKDLMQRAEVLAGKLAARSVGRNQVRTFLDALVHGNGGWHERRQEAQEIARLAPVSWLRRRSSGMPDQLQAIHQELSPLLDGRLAEDDVYFVLTWTARLIQVREARWLPPRNP